MGKSDQVCASVGNRRMEVATGGIREVLHNVRLRVEQPVEGCLH